MDVSDIQMTLVITDNARNVNHCPSLVYVDVYMIKSMKLGTRDFSSEE